ncbi:MAG TPA: hypothetical protein VEK32_17320 [Thermodesulfobacteriota bacterium]|nr:hypothetical protein [Thermodesulfobacteriota bacterium]
MDVFSGDISPRVFKLVVRNEPGEVTLDQKMLRVITELDGKKNVGMIARNVGMELAEVKEIISRLLNHNIIALVDEPIPSLKGDFFAYLTDQLSMATGPMAAVLIEDAVASLGYDLSSFPKHQVQDLVELLARKIFREEKRGIFKLNLFKRISNEEV